MFAYVDQRMQTKDSVGVLPPQTLARVRTGVQTHSLSCNTATIPNADTHTYARASVRVHTAHKQLMDLSLCHTHTHRHTLTRFRSRSRYRSRSLCVRAPAVTDCFWF